MSSANTLRDDAKIIECFENAIVTPSSFEKSTYSFTGCVYDNRGVLIRNSQKTSRMVAWKPADPEFIDLKGKAEEIGGVCIYMGHCTFQYGHFLLETLARFWALDLNIKYDYLIFHRFLGSSCDIKNFSFARECFTVFSIESKKILIADRAMKFRSLLLSCSLLEINFQAHRDQALVYKRILRHCLREARGCDEKLSRLYLSRSRWYKRRRVINEQAMEKIFSDYGFTIIYPNEMAFSDQVILYTRAEVIAGLAGWAMYNSVFLSTGSRAIVIGTAREREREPVNQRICNALAKTESNYIPFRGEMLDELIQSAVFDMEYLTREIKQIL